MVERLKIRVDSEGTGVKTRIYDADTDEAIGSIKKMTLHFTATGPVIATIKRFVKDEHGRYKTTSHIEDENNQLVLEEVEADVVSANIIASKIDETPVAE